MKMMGLIGAAALAASLGAGCGGAGAPSRRPPATTAQRAPLVVGPAAADASATAPGPGAAARRLAASATRFLYARDRARVTVTPATPAFRAELARFPVPAALRGGFARAGGVAAARQSPTTAVASWSITDDRSRTQLAVALSLRGGRWVATGLEAD